MSAQATGWVFAHSPFKGAVFAVHLAIADSVNDQDHYEFWMRQGKLAAKARVSRKAVNDAVSVMIEAGFLVLVLAKKGGANRYAFLTPSEAPVVYDARSADIETIRKVSPTVTTPTAVPVTSGDNHLSPTVTSPGLDLSLVVTGGVSPTVTPVVTPGDTKPKRTQIERKTLSSASADTITVDPQVDELCRLLADAVGARPKRTRPRVTERWRRDMDLLLRRGPLGVDPHPVTVQRVRTRIAWVFDGPGAERSSSGFCWADPVRSPDALRRHWERITDAHEAHKAATNGEALRRSIPPGCVSDGNGGFIRTGVSA